MSPDRIHGRRLEFQYYKGGIPRVTPREPKPSLHSLPPILCIQHRNPILGYSKAPWGLSVLSRVTGIFTGTTISPGGLLRQCPNRYAIRAGQNLPDKEFRYLRTVIVTAAVNRGFGSMLAHIPLTFRHWAGVSPYTSSYDLAQTCVFDKQSLGPILCDSSIEWREHPLFRSYGVNLPSSLTTLLPLALGFSPHLPVSVCGTGSSLRLFSPQSIADFPTCSSVPFARRDQRPGSAISMCQLFRVRRLRNFNRMCIDYAFRPRLSSRLTLGGRTFPRKP